jgi:peptidoglycan/LPS O-acetylase OafA/YrhL
MIRTGGSEFPEIFDNLTAVDRISELVLLKHGCFFAIGGLLWSLLCGVASRAFWGVVILCIAAGCLEIYASGIGHSRMDGQGHSIIVPVVFWLASLVFIVASVVCNRGISEILPVRLARNVGMATYPLYLLHDVTGAALLNLFSKMGLNRWLALALALGLAIAASMSIALWFEPILRRTLGRLLDWRPLRHAAEAS